MFRALSAHHQGEHQTLPQLLDTNWTVAYVDLLVINSRGHLLRSRLG